MTTIKCTKCGEEIELSEALTKDIEKNVLAAEKAKHNVEIETIQKESAEAAAKSIAQAEAKIAAETSAKLNLKMQELQKSAEESQTENKELRKQLTDLMKELRESKKAQENAELEMQKKIAAEEDKIREEATKVADEKQRLNIAAKEKTITDLEKALSEAQRKAAQGSQQMQGEIMELDIESALTNTFRDDDIEPISKGVKGGDVRQVVKSPRGTVCGVMLWEIKRTKNWTAGWVPKLKQDLRDEKANIPIIVTTSMPKDMKEDMGVVDGVWVCKPQLVISLAMALRQGLLDVGLQKAISKNRGGKADALFSFVTSHEFVQQVEAMIETYQEMATQITKERVAYEKIWSQREAQAQRLLVGTANIVGSMQGHIGHTAMPKIKGLELLESGDQI